MRKRYQIFAWMLVAMLPGVILGEDFDDFIGELDAKSAKAEKPNSSEEILPVEDLNDMLKDLETASIDESRPPSQERLAQIETLIQQLGAEGFKERKAAENALKAVTKSEARILRSLGPWKDPEIRARMKRIVSQLDEKGAEPVAAPEKVKEAQIKVQIHGNLQIQPEIRIDGLPAEIKIQVINGDEIRPID